METEIISFGKWVQIRRKQLDLPRTSLARLIGCSSDTIKKIEREERRPSVQIAELMATHLQIPEAKQDDFIRRARGIYVAGFGTPAESPVARPQQTGKTIVTKSKRHNLPSPPTPFIGREAELEALNQLIANPRPEMRLITIVGPGGVGKTRLAVACADYQLAKRRNSPTTPINEVCFVPLALLNEPEQIIPAIAEALDFPLDGGGGQQPRPPKQQIQDYLRQKQMLLVFDNFEHLMDGVGLVVGILENAPAVQILVTSRERLHLHGEQVYPIRGLNFPERDSDLTKREYQDPAEYTAVKLFLQAAQRIQPDFELHQDDYVYLARICRLVSGMPLGVELAAGWVDLLSLREIAAEIEKSLDFLETEMHDVPERHRSMRAVFDASWQRLNTADQAVLAALSVFRGSFTRQAAQQVVKKIVSASKSLRSLFTLVHKSLLIYDRKTDRYKVHSVLQQFVADKLAGDAAVHQAHCDYYSQMLDQTAEDIKSANQIQALAMIDTEFENIHSAWQYAFGKRQHKTLLIMLEPFFNFLDTRSRFQEGEKLFREAADQFGSTDNTLRSQKLQAQLKARQAWFAYHLGDVQASLVLLRESRDTLEQLDASAEAIFNYNYLGAILRDEGEFSKAQTSLHHAWQLAQTLDDDYQASISLNMLGHIAAMQGDRTLARDYCRQALNLKHKIGDSRGLTYSLTYLGRLSEIEEDFQDATRLYEESRLISEQLCDTRGVAMALLNLGRVSQARGQLAEAFSQFEQSLVLYDKIGSHIPVIHLLRNLGQLAVALRRPDEACQYVLNSLRRAADFAFIPEMIDATLTLTHLILEHQQTPLSINHLLSLAVIEHHPLSKPEQRVDAQALINQAAVFEEQKPLVNALAPPSEQFAAVVMHWLAGL